MNYQMNSHINSHTSFSSFHKKFCQENYFFREYLYFREKCRLLNHTYKIIISTWLIISFSINSLIDLWYLSSNANISLRQGIRTITSLFPCSFSNVVKSTWPFSDWWFIMCHFICNKWEALALRLTWYIPPNVLFKTVAKL